MNIWEDDLLDRQRHGAFIYALVRNRRIKNPDGGSFVVNVDARWGQGKSFFMERMYEQVRQSHPAIFINAWKYDYIDDPYTHVVAEFDAYFKSLIQPSKEEEPERFVADIKRYSGAVVSNAGKIIATGIQGGIKRLGRFAISEGFDEIIQIIKEALPDGTSTATVEAIEGVKDGLISGSETFVDSFAQRRIDEFKETKESVAGFQTSLHKILEVIEQRGGSELPMFVFVDELDRCRPTYAIAMLERIKHLFDIPNVAFVVATDTEALSASVKAVYGSEFKSRDYLGRFFHRSFKLPEVTGEGLVTTYLQTRNIQISRLSIPGDEIGLEGISRFITKTYRIFGLSLRQVEQSLGMLQDIIDATDPDYELELTLLYTLICEFVSEGRIDDRDLSSIGTKVRKSNVDWSYSEHGNQSFMTLIERLYGLRNHSIVDAFSNIQELWRSTNGADIRYIYDFLQKERTTKSLKNTEVLTEISSYTWLVTHAYNALITEDDSDTQN